MASVRASFNLLARSSLRAAAAPSVGRRALLAGPSRLGRLYSAKAEEAPAAEAGPAEGNAELVAAQEKIETQAKTIAELKNNHLLARADFENLQKISAREKAQAKDFALTKFAKDLIGSIDVLRLALNSVPADVLSASDVNKDLKGLHEGVALTKTTIEKVLARHGVTSFDPTGEQFDPNLHEALYQAPIPGKEPNSVLECQEIGYMINNRVLRPAKVGVVQATD